MPNKIAILVALVYTVALTVASLITLSGMPELGTSMDDKVYHVLAYIVLTVLWFYTLNQPVKSGQLLLLALCCIAFGIIIEAIQGKVNMNRVGDVLDIIANIVGVILGLIYCIFSRKKLS